MLNSFLSSDFIFHPSSRGCSRGSKIRVEGEISKNRENGDFCNKTGFMGILRMLNSFLSSDFIFHPSTKGCKIRVGGEISKYRENGDFCNKTEFMGVFEDAEFISEFRFHYSPFFKGKSWGEINSASSKTQ